MQRSMLSACLFVVWSLLLVLAPASEVAAEVITWKATGKGGAVAAGQMNSVAAGIQILNEGGNAADAAAATLLALSITDYGSFAIGGEVPMLIYDAKSQEVKVLCGMGSAPLDRDAIDWFYANGIPAKGISHGISAPVGQIGTRAQESKVDIQLF